MKIQEAIETNISIKKVCKDLLPPLEQQAISLGIEAMKRILSLRLEPEDYEITKLPGETKD